jgi:hypothetical protein
MVPITRRDDVKTPMAQAAYVPRVDARHDDGNSQPQMSVSDSRPREQDNSPDPWMVPDTRDDIVVSRQTDY